MPSIPTGGRLYIARSDGVTAIDLDSGKVTPKLIDGKRLHAALPLGGWQSSERRAAATNTATLFEAA